ncbi:MAG: hypothetical protein QNL57_00520, partial [Alphaproteobacteria bacterium]
SDSAADKTGSVCFVSNRKSVAVISSGMANSFSDHSFSRADTSCDEIRIAVTLSRVRRDFLMNSFP